MSARKTKAQLAAELNAANKRISDLTDALIRAMQAQPVYVPYAVPVAQPYIPAPYVDPSPWWQPGGTWCGGTICVALDAAPANVALNAPVQS